MDISQEHKEILEEYVAHGRARGLSNNQLERLEGFKEYLEKSIEFTVKVLKSKKEKYEKSV